MERLGALFHGYLLQSWGPRTATMVESELEATTVAEALLGQPALRGEPARARAAAMEETRRVLRSEAVLQALDRVVAGLFMPLRAKVEKELAGCLPQRSMHVNPSTINT